MSGHRFEANVAAVVKEVSWLNVLHKSPRHQRISQKAAVIERLRVLHGTEVH